MRHVSANEPPHTLATILPGIFLFRAFPIVVASFVFGPFIAWALGVARIELLRWRRSVSRNKIVLEFDDNDSGVTSYARVVHTDYEMALVSHCSQRVLSHSAGTGSWCLRGLVTR